MLSKTKWLVAVLALSMAVSACGEDTSDDAAGGAPTESTDDGGGAPGVTVSAINFAFDPREVEVEAGAALEITFVNKDEAPHTFTSGDLGVDVRADPGETVTASATAPDSGSAEFHCEIHSSMSGTISVAGASGAGAGGGGSEGESGTEGDKGTGGGGSGGSGYQYDY